MMRRLVIVADASVIAHAVRAVADSSGFALVGELDGRESIGGSVAKMRPAVVLVDDMRNREQAIARLQEVAIDAADAKCVLLTHDMEASWVDRAFEAGASVVLCKSVHPSVLVTLLRETVDGTVIHCSKPARRKETANQCRLTSRELEVLGLVAQGMTNGSIARDLWLTEETVKFHLSNVYRKLGVSNRTEASHYAHVHGIVTNTPPPQRGGPRPIGDVRVAA